MVFAVLLGNRFAARCCDAPYISARAGDERFLWVGLNGVRRGASVADAFLGRMDDEI